MSAVPTQASAARLTLARRLLAQVDTRALLSGALLFALFSALFAFVQFGTSALADNDGFYHLRMAALMREHGLRVPFTWLPLSILNQDAFYDHHLLYHVYLALFAGGSDQATLVAAKWASSFLPAAACVAIWWLLRGQKIRYAALWALGLFAVSEAFLYRMSMPRAQAASLLVLALGLHLLLQRKFTWLIPLGFLYVWLYNAFPLLIVLAVVYAVAAFLSERRIEWKAVIYPAVGIALGLIVNPYFPQNIAFIVNHLAPKIGELGVSVGNEWYPYDTWVLIENSGFAMAAFIAGIFALGWRGKKFDRATLTAFVLAVLFGLLTFKSRRFIEYFPAFALIFTALAVGRVANSPTQVVDVRHKRWYPIGLLAILIAPLIITVTQARATLADQSKPADTYAAASYWITQHAEPGALIFQTDWDDFPRLFFYNPANVYTIGLDPTYMQLYDAALYDEWVKITQGKVERPGVHIRSRFGGEYVITDLKHTAFLKQARNDPGLKEVFRDKYAVVFEVSQ
ncbi:hypothetical protein TFLX_00205 [Thermoflexales bacterium]|nr:hypothetical protein TFLX_00205 [Thermoflexales bacterium]